MGEVIRKIINFYSSLTGLQRTLFTFTIAVLLTVIIIGIIIALALWWRGKNTLKDLQTKDKYEFEKQKAKSKKEQKQREKYSEVYLDNPILEMILHAFNIIIFGGLGAGKTLFANLLVHYLNLKYNIEDKHNRRYNKNMRSEYVKELELLKEKKKLRIYANMDLEDEEGNTAQDLWPALFQEVRVVENGIFLTDEFGEKLGKDLWQIQQSAKDPRIDRATDTARYARQIKNIKWIGTEQSHDNIFKPIRDKGFLEVQALRTYVWVSKSGKFKRAILELFRKMLPGYFTTNIVAEFRKSFFISDKIKTGFKLLLPTFLTLPQTYYRNITVTAGKIKNKYTNFQTVVSVNGNEYMFHFTNQDIFKYNTRAAKYRYDEQFDKNGERVWKTT